MHQKIPEYLLAGPPIIAIVPRNSAVAEIIECTGTGYVIAADSDWAQGIRDIFERDSATTRPRRREAEIQRFSWQFVRRQWLEALDLPREPFPDESHRTNQKIK